MGDLVSSIWWRAVDMMAARPRSQQQPRATRTPSRVSAMKTVEYFDTTGYLLDRSQTWFRTFQSRYEFDVFEIQWIIIAISGVHIIYEIFQRNGPDLQLKRYKEIHLRSKFRHTLGSSPAQSSINLDNGGCR